MAAIGLQDVDGLTPSNYMLEAVCRNIEGESTQEKVLSTQETATSTQERITEYIYM